MNSYHVLGLLERLAERYAKSLDKPGCDELSKEIDRELHVSGRYLNDLYRKTKKDIKDGVLNCRPSRYKLDIIARHMDYESFEQFSQAMDKPIPGMLRTCAGNWWSYVRANSGDHLLKAPVRIFVDETRQAMRMELKGSESNFNGKLEEKGSCMFGFLESGADKRIGLVFKLGNTRQLELLQGVFCGMSTPGDPIAGREVLVRENDLSYEEMSWSEHSLTDKKIHEKIRKYFSKYEGNCIKVRDVEGFRLENLKIRNI